MALMQERARWWSGFRAVALGLLLAVAGAPLAAQEAVRPEATAPAATNAHGRLLDAVVEATQKHFWDKDRLAAVGWSERAASARKGVVEASSREEAARRINALLAELGTSHTGLLTPDDVDYYILLDVFAGNRSVRNFVAERFWGGVRYPGIGIFSVRIDGRDFVDSVLEGSPADRAGLQAGDEIVSVDGGPYHPVRSFRGHVGEEVAVTRRRRADAEPDTLRVRVVAIAPLRAFRDATLASARVIERDGRRIGYVHVWASVGDASVDALREALETLGGDREREAAEGRGRPREQQRTPPLDGVVVDMRGKIGGTGSTAARYLEVLDPRGPLVVSRNKGAREPRALRGRTAVLIDRRTRSTGELFVHAYKRERQGPLVGTRTAGAVSAAAAYIMPGGNLLYLAVTGLSIDGEVLEGVGVSPDVEVDRPLPYAEGADPVLDAAVALLAQRPPRPDAARPAAGP